MSQVSASTSSVAATAAADSPGIDTAVLVDPVAEPAPCPRKATTRRTLFGAACMSLQPMILSALMLPVTAYVIRGLGPAGYGQWAIATTLVAVVAVVANPGLRGMFIRGVARQPETAGQALAEQIGVRLVLSLAAVLIAVVVCVVLHYPATVVLCTFVSGLGLMLLTVSTTIADLFQALQRLPVVAGVNMAAGLVLSLVSVLAVWMGAGPVGVALTYLINPITAIVLFCLIARRNRHPVRIRWDARKAGQLIWKGRHIAYQQITWSAAQHAQALMIPRLMGATMFGFFSAGSLLAGRLTSIPEGLCSAAYPAMVEAHRHGPRAVLRVFFRFLALVLPASMLAALGVTLVAGPIAKLLFPGRHEVCQQVMQITVWLLPPMGLHFLIGYLLQALDKDPVQAKFTLVGSAFSLLLTVVLVWQWGMVGACWSMVFRYTLDLAMEIPYLFRIFGRLLVAEREGRAVAGAALVPVASAGPGMAEAA
jgi:O-antigen/teichoic acid export membrane protein